MTHEFKLIPRDESIVVREDEMIEGAVKALRDAKPDAEGIDWPVVLDDAAAVEKIVRRIAKRGGFRVGRETAPRKGDRGLNVRFYRLGEPKPRAAKPRKPKGEEGKA